MPEAPAAPESLYALDGSVKSAVGVVIPIATCSDEFMVIAVASALEDIPATPPDASSQAELPLPCSGIHIIGLSAPPNTLVLKSASPNNAGGLMLPKSNKLGGCGVSVLP